MFIARILRNNDGTTTGSASPKSRKTKIGSREVGKKIAFDKRYMFYVTQYRAILPDKIEKASFQINGLVLDRYDFLTKIGHLACNSVLES